MIYQCDCCLEYFETNTTKRKRCAACRLAVTEGVMGLIDLDTAPDEYFTDDGDDDVIYD